MAPVFSNVMNGADVGMIQRGGCTGLAAEALERLRVRNDIFGKELDRDKAAKLRVLGFVDHAHATAAQLFKNAVMRDCLPNDGKILGHKRLHDRHGGCGSQRGVIRRWDRACDDEQGIESRQVRSLW